MTHFTTITCVDNDQSFCERLTVALKFMFLRRMTLLLDDEMMDKLVEYYQQDKGPPVEYYQQDKGPPVETKLLTCRENWARFLRRTWQKALKG